MTTEGASGAGQPASDVAEDPIADLAASAEVVEADLDSLVAERDEMRRALNRFKNLSAAQRSQCIRNFSKLAQLSAPDGPLQQLTVGVGKSFRRGRCSFGLYH